MVRATCNISAFLLPVMSFIGPLPFAAWCEICAWLAFSWRSRCVSSVVLPLACEPRKHLAAEPAGRRGIQRGGGGTLVDCDFGGLTWRGKKRRASDLPPNISELSA